MGMQRDRGESRHLISNTHCAMFFVHVFCIYNFEQIHPLRGVRVDHSLARQIATASGTTRRGQQMNSRADRLPYVVGSANGRIHFDHIDGLQASGLVQTFDNVESLSQRQSTAN